LFSCGLVHRLFAQQVTGAMSMVCPQCDELHEQRLTCPRCGGRLHYRGERRQAVLAQSGATRWLNSAWGRLVLGLVLAQGLTYAVHRLYSAFSLAFHDQLQTSESDPNVYLLLQGLQLLALVIGAGLAGGGQRAGALLGALVGLANGALTLAFQNAGGLSPSPAAWVSELMVHAAFGTAAGWIASSIWKPLPAVGGAAAPKFGKLGAVRRAMALFGGRVAWLRVGAGATLAVLGSLSATILLEMAVHAAEARITYITPTAVEIRSMQESVLTWEVKALAILLGAGLAGSNTRNGVKQGLFVGLAVTTALAIALAWRGQATTSILTGTLISAFCLSIVGGWFGSQLLPPIVRVKRARGMGPATI
jgi:hypothetical protein